MVGGLVGMKLARQSPRGKRSQWMLKNVFFCKVLYYLTTTYLQFRKIDMANFLICEKLSERFVLLELAGNFCVKIDSKTHSVCHKDHFEVQQKLIRSPPF